MKTRSPVLAKLLRKVRQAAQSEANILIIGENGTGKTRLAAEIHRLSHRRKAPFVTVSCPSLSRELLKSELFGHLRGSFTGALKDRGGKVSRADQGTLFLDEIGDLPLDIQPNLLRLLQEKEYERLGESQPRRADVRVIAASNHNLSRAVRDGLFRKDLFYRLNVITLKLPPLKDRAEDILPLARQFLHHFGRQCGKPVREFSHATRKWMRTHPWPGNIRELQNFVERAVIFADDSEVKLEGPPQPADPLHEDQGNPSHSNLQVGQRVSLQNLECEHIRRILKSTATLEEAAHVLGIDTATLYRKRKKLRLP